MKKKVAQEVNLIVKAKVRELAKEMGLNVSSAFFDEFNNTVYETLQKAADRAERNKRKTLLAQDL